MTKWIVAFFSVLAFTAGATAQDGRGEATDPKPGGGLAQPSWNQFRGPRVDARADADGLFSSTDGFGLRKQWQVPLGSGYSGVSVADGVAVTLFSDGENDIAAGYDAETGRELWRFAFEPPYPGLDGSFNGPISTPLIAEGYVVGLGGAGRLFALNLRDGSLAWSTDLQKDHEVAEPFYGFSTSPLYVDGRLILQLGGENKALAGLDIASGRVLWSAGSDAVAYQNPIPVTLGGKPHIMAAGNSKLIGIDPADGTVLWEYEHGGRSPRGSHSMVPVQVSADQFFLKTKADRSALVRFSMQDGKIVGEQVWEERSIRNTYAIAVAHEGYVYGFSSRFLTCVDPATGKSLWKSRPPGDGFLMLADGHLVTLTKNGSLHIAEASPEGYEEKASIEVFEDLSWTPPVLAGNSLYLRSLGEMARIDVVSSRVMADSGDQPKPIELESRFADQVAAIEASNDKEAAIQDFLSGQDSFPIIEEPDLVHFVYHGPGMDLAVAGDFAGARQEKRMRRIEGTPFFHYSARLDPAARVNYIFMRDFEEITDPRNPLKTTTGILGADMEFVGSGEMEMSWLAMPGWEAPTHLEALPDGHLRGTLDEVEMPSQLMKDNPTLRVYLPAGYDDDPQRRYPVVYWHESEGALTRGAMRLSLDRLTGDSVEPLIGVLLELGRVQDYPQVWAGEVVPFIDARYRTRADRDSRVHAGASSGAFAALNCAFRRPEMASKVGVQSLDMLDFMRIPLEAAAPSADQHPLTIYMDWGHYDLTNPQENWDVPSVNRAFVEFLRSKGYRPQAEEAPDGAGWASWKNRTDDLLEALLPLEGGSSGD